MVLLVLSLVTPEPYHVKYSFLAMYVLVLWFFLWSCGFWWLIAQGLGIFGGLVGVAGEFGFSGVFGCFEGFVVQGGGVLRSRTGGR